ncbi:MAG: hypothetical protein RIR00_2363, partial [Pseudomonadota bacterium]
YLDFGNQTLDNGKGFWVNYPGGGAGSISYIEWGKLLIANVSPEKNTYGEQPNYIYWAGVAGQSGYENRTECSSFVTRLLLQSYPGLNIGTWLGYPGATNPNAAKYHDAIVNQTGLQAVAGLTDLRAGDLIAIKYPAGGSSSGHLMIALGGLRAREASAPLIASPAGQTYAQYEVDVMDSANSGHGYTDTRYLGNNTWNDGAGIGVLRIYTDASGQIAGYTWSTRVTSAAYFYSQDVNHLVIGRPQL